MPSTYHDLYLDTRRTLKKAGVDSAALEAREIVCCASHKSKEEFVRDGRLYTSSEIETKVQSMLQRRLQGEPVAYLVGEWEFPYCIAWPQHGIICIQTVYYTVWL